MNNVVFMRYQSVISVAVIGLFDITCAFWLAIVILILNIGLEKVTQELIEVYKDYIKEVDDIIKAI